MATHAVKRMRFYPDPTADAVGWVRTTTTATMMAMMASSNASASFIALRLARES